MFPLLSVYYSTCAGGNHQYSGFLFSSPIFLVCFLYSDQTSCFFCCIFYYFWSAFQHSFRLLSQFLVSRFLYFYRDTGPCSDPGFHQKFSFFLFKQLQPFFGHSPHHNCCLARSVHSAVALPWLPPYRSHCLQFE